MKYQKFLKRIFGAGFIIALLMGCSTPATQAPTLLPLITTLTAPIAPTGQVASPIEFVWRIKGEPYRLDRPAAMALDAEDNLLLGYLQGSGHDHYL